MSTEPSNRKLLTIDDVRRLDLATIETFYRNHHNPGLTELFKTLGFNRIRIESSEGLYYSTADGRRVLDLWGGYGSLNHGHNHPRILAVRRSFMEHREVDINMAFYSPYVAGLTHNLSLCLPADLECAVLANSGAEAVEGALKLAEKYHGKKRPRFIHFSNSFHGKTHAALSVTSHEQPKRHYRLLDHCEEVPFGDLAALETALNPGGGGRCDAAAVIVEPIQGNGGVVPAPAGFLAGIRELCTRTGALMIVDEIASGFGRTGRMFAFEHDGIVPDVVTMAKSLGGGKSAISAFSARRRIFLKAYGSSGDSSLLSTTFAGMGEACATAIEALNIIYDEHLMENASEQGAYFLSRLENLRERHPKVIKDVRGRGLMIGVEFHDFGKILLPVSDALARVLGPNLNGAYAALAAVELLFEHDILVALTAARPNVLRLLPPLIITREEIDRALEALEAVLSLNVLKLGLKTARRRFKD